MKKIKCFQKLLKTCKKIIKYLFISYHMKFTTLIVLSNDRNDHNISMSYDTINPFEQLHRTMCMLFYTFCFIVYMLHQMCVLFSIPKRRDLYLFIASMLYLIFCGYSNMKYIFYAIIICTVYITIVKQRHQVFKCLLNLMQFNLLNFLMWFVSNKYISAYSCIFSCLSPCPRINILFFSLHLLNYRSYTLMYIDETSINNIKHKKN
jgi:hypothetical protein